MSNHEARNGRGLRPVPMTLAAVLLLAGCATAAPPDYRPLAPGGSVGYSDLKLSPNSYRVSFSGSPASTRNDVANYLLRRAAEVTLATGHTHFVITDRDSESEPYYYGANYGPPYYDPYYYYPYPGWQTNTYSTSADVVMLNADEAAGNPRAIDAANLLRRLEPPLPVASAATPPRG